MTDPIADAPLRGAQLLLAGIALAVANFMVILDLTIANVSVVHIAGALSITPTQGTWVITSYAVAEAVCVPLTGWLTTRFGAVRTFLFGMGGFGLFSLLCGVSNSLTMLVICRIGQGMCGGPVMPLSQTLMLRIFPKDQGHLALGLWSVTTLLGPIAGPLLGGAISDNLNWHWIFLINVPVAVLCIAGTLTWLRGIHSETRRMRVDLVGLGLLIVWVGALQLMLDSGRDRDWFNDAWICTLAATTVIGFLAFVIWELTEDEPIVSLRIFRHGGYSVTMVGYAFTFTTFFASQILIPQITQTGFGYTSTWAGYVSALSGASAVLVSPFITVLMKRVDPRWLVFAGTSWMGVSCIPRMLWPSQADFWALAIPQLMQGIGIPMFFLSTTAIALGSVDPDETASAAGIMNFIRTAAGAIGASLTMTLWEADARVAHADMAASLQPEQTLGTLSGLGIPLDQARLVIEQLVSIESITKATTEVYGLAALIFAISSLIIFKAPRPRAEVDTSAAH